MTPPRAAAADSTSAGASPAPDTQASQAATSRGLARRLPKGRPTAGGSLETALAMEGGGRTWSVVHSGPLEQFHHSVLGLGGEVVESRDATLEEIFLARAGRTRPPTVRRSPVITSASSRWPLPATPAMPTISPARTWSERSRSAGSPADRDALTSGNEWGMQIADGRSSEALLAFLERMRQLIARGAPLTVTGFDSGDTAQRARVLAAFVQAMPVGPTQSPPSSRHHEELLRRECESGIRRLADASAGVILGRGAAVALGRDRGFHVRLDGPAERRLAQGAAVEGIGQDEARRHLAAADRARTAYVRRLYRADPADPRHYHLVIDSTAITLEAVTDIIVRALRSPAVPAAWQVPASRADSA